MLQKDAQHEEKSLRRAQRLERESYKAHDAEKTPVAGKQVILSSKLIEIVRKNALIFSYLPFIPLREVLS